MLAAMKPMLWLAAIGFCHAGRSKRHMELEWLKSQFVHSVTRAAASRGNDRNLRPVSAALLDVGANSGQFSRELMVRLGRHQNALALTRLIMFEPQPKFHERLAALRAEYHGTLVTMAAWTMNTSLSFHLNLNNTETASLVDNTMNDREMNERQQKWRTTTVPAIDLTEFLLRELPMVSAKDPNASISYLKLDVEGAEYEILPRLLNKSALCRLSFIEIEWHLRYLPMEKKLAGLALRDALSDILKGMCVPSPVVVHNDMPINNIVAGIQGLEKRAEMVEAYRRRRWGATAAKHTADTRK